MTTSLDTLMIIISILLYLAPGLIAYRYNRKDKDLIFILNLLFGWTFLGWAATLVWAIAYNND